MRDLICPGCGVIAGQPHKPECPNGAAVVKAGAGILIRARNTGRLLLQKRGPGAKDFPGTWDLSAGGPLKGAETPIQAVARETREELGPVPELVIWGEVTWMRLTGLYTLYMAECDEEFLPEGGTQRDAVTDWLWADRDDISRLPLHPVFAKEIAALAEDGALAE